MFTAADDVEACVVNAVAADTAGTVDADSVSFLLLVWFWSAEAVADAFTVSSGCCSSSTVATLSVN